MPSTQYPDLNALTVLDADVLSAMLDTYVIKPSDTTRASNVTPTADPDLVTDNLDANGIYAVEFHVRFGSLNGAGIKTIWTVPSGSSGLRDTIGPGPNNAVEANASNTEMKWTVSQFTTNIPYTNPRNSVTLLTHLIEKSVLTIGPAAGPISFGWAQNASAATGTAVVTGSYVKWRRIG